LGRGGLKSGSGKKGTSRRRGKKNSVDGWEKEKGGQNGRKKKRKKVGYQRPAAKAQRPVLLGGKKKESSSNGGDMAAGLRIEQRPAGRLQYSVEKFGRKRFWQWEKEKT